MTFRPICIWASRLGMPAGGEASGGVRARERTTSEVDRVMSKVAALGRTPTSGSIRPAPPEPATSLIAGPGVTSGSGPQGSSAIWEYAGAVRSTAAEVACAQRLCSLPTWEARCSSSSSMLTGAVVALEPGMRRLRWEWWGDDETPYAGADRQVYGSGGDRGATAQDVSCGPASPSVPLTNVSAGPPVRVITSTASPNELRVGVACAGAGRTRRRPARAGRRANLQTA
jgi:hypothetical protein